MTEFILNQTTLFLYPSPFTKSDTYVTWSRVKFTIQSQQHEDNQFHLM